MKTKNALLICSLLLITACQGIKVDQDNDKSGYNKKTFEKAQDQFCSKGQTLEILDKGTDALFSDLVSRSRIFGFSKKGGPCITKANINESWVENGAHLWFNLNPNSDNNCLQNNSLWEVTNSSTNGFGQYYSMRSLDDPSQRLMEMNAHQAVRGTYAAEKAGLSIFICQ